MDSRAHAIAHAAACREAIVRGEQRPAYAGPSLQGTNLRGADLRGVNLEGVILQGVILQGVDLSGANLEGANLERADLECAILRDAILQNAMLRYADLEGANLRYANLKGAKLDGANLKGAKLDGANLENAMLRYADLENAMLWYADLEGANLDCTTGITVPFVPGLASLVLAQIEQYPWTHVQNVWHSICGTRHCVAGWVVQLAGGRKLELRTSTPSAAYLLLREAHGEIPLPAPFGEGDDPLPWLREIAGRRGIPE